jgi:hypothetical protein
MEELMEEVEEEKKVPWGPGPLGVAKAGSEPLSVLVLPASDDSRSVDERSPVTRKKCHDALMCMSKK